MIDKVETPTHKKSLRAFISTYCLQAEQWRLRWHYSQVRPFAGFGVSPAEWHVADCSAYCSLAFYWAMHHTGIYVTDPLYGHYSGYGNTQSQYVFLAPHQAPVGKYLVGDMAIMGTAQKTVHTLICRKAGDAETAIFSSNGHEAFNFPSDAPNPMSLNTAKKLQPLVGVYRHPALL